MKLFLFYLIKIFLPFYSNIILIKFGISGLKGYLYENTNLFVENLPFNSRVLKFIKIENQKHWSSFLDISIDERLVKVSEHLGFLMVIAEHYKKPKIDRYLKNKINHSKKMF